MSETKSDSLSGTKSDWVSDIKPDSVSETDRITQRVPLFFVNSGNSQSFVGFLPIFGKQDYDILQAEFKSELPTENKGVYGMNRIRIAIIVCVACIGFCLTAFGDSTINVVNRFAYGANVGWLDARGDVTNGVVIGQFYCKGYLWGANIGWISLGSGTPSNGWQYANNSATDWGVNHDGAGNLTGYAYGANVGWIAFEQTYGQPRVNLHTGDLSGYVWGANIGWIALETDVAHVRTDILDTGPDADGDGIPDAWEYMMAGDLTTLGPHPDDYDGDGVSDYHEYLAGTDPLDATSFFVVTNIYRQGDTNWVEWTVQPTRQYQLVRTDSLTGTPVWADSGFGVMAPDPAQAMTRSVVTNAVPQFYRVRAIVPLAP